MRKEIYEIYIDGKHATLTSMPGLFPLAVSVGEEIILRIYERPPVNVPIRRILKESKKS